MSGLFALMHMKGAASGRSGSVHRLAAGNSRRPQAAARRSRYIDDEGIEVIEVWPKRPNSRLPDELEDRSAEFGELFEFPDIDSGIIEVGPGQRAAGGASDQDPGPTCDVLKENVTEACVEWDKALQVWAGADFEFKAVDMDSGSFDPVMWAGFGTVRRHYGQIVQQLAVAYNEAVAAYEGRGCGKVGDIEGLYCSDSLVPLDPND